MQHKRNSNSCTIRSYVCLIRPFQQWPRADGEGNGTQGHEGAEDDEGDEGDEGVEGDAANHTEYGGAGAEGHDGAEGKEMGRDQHCRLRQDLDPRQAVPGYEGRCVLERPHHAILAERAAP